MAKISVILPICNVEAYLREALDSVINQTMNDLEIICVDDGSKDHSLEIIEEYARQDQRIVVITGPNGGYGKAMNKGLDRATGEYIGILEPDDYLPAEMFEELYGVATEHDLDWVKADFYRFTRDENGQENRQYVLLDESKQRYGELLCPAEDPSCIYFTMNTWTGIYRRTFLEEHHIRHHETPGASFQDNGFFFQTFAFAKRAMILNKPYYRNRRDNPNSSVKNKAKVYCMNIEYDWIRDLLMQDSALWQRFCPMYWWIKYRNYWFTYHRIDDSFKSEFMARMRQEFKRAHQLGQLDSQVFTQKEWKDLQAMIQHSEGISGLVKSIPLAKNLAPYVPQPVKKVIINGFREAAKAKRWLVGKVK